MFASEEIKPNICLTTKNFETARRLASGGYALTIIPKQYLKIFNTPYDSDYYFIDNKYNYWYSCILTNKENYLSQISQQLLKKVRKLYQDNYSI